MRSFTLKSIQHGLERGLAKTTVETGLFVVLESVTEPFRPVVKGIPKWFVDALDIVATSHKDLDHQPSIRRDQPKRTSKISNNKRHTRSKAVEHARGCVTTKMGLSDMVLQGLFTGNVDG